MAETMSPGPGCDERSIREAVCVHTKKIFDSCRDQDCIPDLRVYFGEHDQKLIDESASVKAGSAQLLQAYIDVQPVHFNRGFFTVEVRYFYRISAEVSVCGGRPIPVSGMANFSKRCVLFGGEGGARVFSSVTDPEAPAQQSREVPEAVVEVIDPIILDMKLVDVCHFRPAEGGCAEIPASVADCFEQPLTTGGDVHRLYVTLGQFSLVRLERDTQLLMPVYDYCIPCKECCCDDGESKPRDPCELFAKVKFPMDSFFPASRPGDCPDCCCGCKKTD